MSGARTRYTAAAIVLHWAIAGAIVLMMGLGLWMHQLSERGVVNDGVFRAYQLHKSIGLTILALSVARLAWRLFNPAPPLPGAMKPWELVLARATHWVFYGLMIALPLSGWLYVSAGWSIHDDTALSVTTRWFSLFVVPHLFGLDQAGEAVRSAAAFAAFRAHALMSWAMLGLFVLHVAAALKHQFLDKDDIMARMVPGLPTHGEAAPRDPLRLAVLGSGLSLTAVALIAAALAWSDMASEATAASATAPPIEAATLESSAAPIAPPPPSGEAAAIPATASAPTWTVDAARSSIGWSFIYTENNEEQRFNGRFAQWTAAIAFDPANLAASEVTVRIATASASDGVPLHDGTLRSAGWFNVAAHPQAEFRATRIVHLGGANYRADGQLTLRGATQAVALPFTLRIEGQRAVMDGRVTLDRRAYGVGNGADADTDVSTAVDVVVHVEAARNP
jgi:cytochrome b561